MNWLSGLHQDIAFAIRILAKDHRFTLAAVLALGLAIGVNNSVFKLINTSVLRDLPFEDPDRLVAVRVLAPRGPTPISYPEFADWQRTTRSMEGLAATMNSVMTISEPDLPPERFRGTYVSANTFRLLRTTPILGRDFRSEDDRPGAPAVVMLGHRVWQSRYGGDPNVIGRTVRVSDVPSTIVGVMPPDFRYPGINEMWQPLALAPALAKPTRAARVLAAFGRLADGVDLARAHAEFETIGAQWATEFPETNRDLKISVISMGELWRRWTPMLGVFMGAVAFVLVIACANLANLLLARSMSRSREMAIRASLGATRARIVRQLLVECLIIALVASVLGTVFSIYGANTIAVGFDAIEPGAPPGSTRPFWVDLSMDTTTYLFIGLLCAFATLACGLVPALLSTRAGVNDVLKEGGRGSGTRIRWWSTSFIVAEIALTLMLLASAGLLWRGFIARYQRDLIIDSSNLLIARVGLPVQKYNTPESRQRFYDQLEERLASMPVSSSTIANVPPFDFGAASREVILDSDNPTGVDQRPRVFLIQTGARYFETVKLPVVQGRILSASDGLAGQEGVVVDQAFVAKFFPDGNALGRRIRLAQPSTPSAPTPPAGPAPWLTVVGVAPSLPYFGPRELAQPIVYAPMTAIALQGPGAILVRAGSDLGRVVALLRNEVQRLDPDLPLYAVETMDDAVARSRWPVRLMGTWFSIIALIALVLASVGLYALTAHGVVQRTQEIGVRMALGAQRSQVLWLFLRRAAVQLAIGLTLGIAGALATGRLLQGYLDQVSPRDPLTLILVAVFLVLVAGIASVVPARRATRVDPLVALRYE